MRSLDSNTLSALSEGSVILRTFLYIHGKDSIGDPVKFGFWNGEDNVSVSVSSLLDAQTESRSYVGTGAIVSIPQIPLKIGLEARTIEFGLNQIHPSVLSMVQSNDIRHAKTEVHRGLMSISTGQLVAAPHGNFLGKINGAPIHVPAAGGEGRITLRIASTTRDLTITNPARKSDETQRLRSGDRSRRYTDVAGRVGVWWGEEKR